MNNKFILMGRAAFAGLLLTVSATLLGAVPSHATESYSFDTKLSTTRTFDYQPTFGDLATARISRVGITPIPIP
jgi:hypothetical protein